MMDISPQLRSHVEKATGRSIGDAPVHKLKGEASSRTYYRVGAAPESWVLMVMPPSSLTQSDEKTKGLAPDELPFLNVQRYLKSLGIRVPDIFHFDADAGVMVLEDLSDLTFEHALKSAPLTELYQNAVRLLARLRARAERKVDTSCLAFTRAFDEELYDWEFHHFREWGLEAWSRKTPSEEERALLNRWFKDISAQLASLPKGFTHRDYQSRNLMVKDGELVVIDFQDALLGPRQYDLVALLRDSYVELPRDFVEAMLDEYVRAFEQEGGERIEARAFKATFDLLTVQRKLKDAARFEFIHRVKNNPNFLPSIPASLKYVKEAFDAQPRLAELRSVIARYVPEVG